MRKNSGKVITRYQFCTLFKSAWLKCATVMNAESSFRSTGIFPLCEEVIPDDAYETLKTINQPFNPVAVPPEFLVVTIPPKVPVVTVTPEVHVVTVTPEGSVVTVPPQVHVVT